MTLRRLAERARPDRKGKGLLLMAVAWVALGAQGPGQRVPIDSAWHFLIPDPITVIAWTGTGLLAAAAAYSRRLRPAAVGALIFMPGIRAASYATAWVIYLLPGGAPGYERAYLFLALQAVMIGFVLFVATEKEETTVEDVMRALARGEGREQ